MKSGRLLKSRSRTGSVPELQFRRVGPAQRDVADFDRSAPAGQLPGMQQKRNLSGRTAKSAVIRAAPMDGGIGQRKRELPPLTAGGGSRQLILMRLAFGIEAAERDAAGLPPHPESEFPERRQPAAADDADITAAAGEVAGEGEQAVPALILPLRSGELGAARDLPERRFSRQPKLAARNGRKQNSGKQGRRQNQELSFHISWSRRFSPSCTTW